MNYHDETVNFWTEVFHQDFRLNNDVTRAVASANAALEGLRKTFPKSKTIKGGKKK